MKHPVLAAAGVMLLMAGLPNVMMATPGAPPRVAVVPLTVERDSAGVLRAAADSCLEHLVRGLTAKGVTVDRLKQLTEKTVRSARPAVLAVIGRVTHDKGLFHVELQLLDVESGEELRSYFNSDKSPAGLARTGDGVAGRIVTVLQERKAGGPEGHG